jgi:hypothetical protein
MKGYLPNIIDEDLMEQAKDIQEHERSQISELLNRWNQIFT